MDDDEGCERATQIRVSCLRDDIIDRQMTLATAGNLTDAERAKWLGEIADAQKEIAQLMDDLRAAD